jgi:hypothetical protein
MLKNHKIKPKKHEMRRIARMDYPRCAKAWWVRIYKGCVMVSHHTFLDSGWGGKRKALKEAQKWRDKMEIQILGGCYTYGKPYRNMIQKNNSSGKTGVFYQTGYVRGYYYPSWTATWCDNGVPKLERFYVHHFSTSMDAKQAATKFRRGMEKILEGR